MVYSEGKVKQSGVEVMQGKVTWWSGFSMFSQGGTDSVTLRKGGYGRLELRFGEVSYCQVMYWYSMVVSREGGV